MAQETVIHRVDAELAAAGPLAAIPGDLAADGIDELLVAFVQYDIALLPDKFADLLASAGDRTIGVETPQRSWLISLTAGAVHVDGQGGGSPDATVRGLAPQVLLWLWNRGWAYVTHFGDVDQISLLHNDLAAGHGHQYAVTTARLQQLPN